MFLECTRRSESIFKKNLQVFVRLIHLAIIFLTFKREKLSYCQLKKEIPMPKKYWLMKSEPHVFSFEDLKLAPNQTEPWEGVRNYQARNFMRDEMKKGDLVLFYHSSCPEPGVAGIAKVVSESYPDPTSWDPKGKYFDPKSSKENPRWFMVDIKWEKNFKTFVSLKNLKEIPELSSMRLLQKGNRLSVMPIEPEHFIIIKKMGS